MKKIITWMVLFMCAFCYSEAKSDTLGLCLKKEKDLTCEDLEYKDNWVSGKRCTLCPILGEAKYSCIGIPEKTTYNLKDLTLVPLNDELKTCEAFPSCSDLGYRIAKINVAKIGSEYSCTACPLDGNWWACAKGGLKRP